MERGLGTDTTAPGSARCAVSGPYARPRHPDARSRILGAGQHECNCSGCGVHPPRTSGARYELRDTGLVLSRNRSSSFCSARVHCQERARAACGRCAHVQGLAASGCGPGHSQIRLRVPPARPQTPPSTPECHPRSQWGACCCYRVGRQKRQ